ncbi:MAG: cell division protein FtsA [Patescibacteria group bacterium]
MARRSQPQMITGVDIGSTAIRVAVGQASAETEGKPRLQIIGAVEVASEGVNRGVITSIEDTVSSISNAIEQTERLVGLPIEHAWIGFGGIQIVSQQSKGVVAVAKSDGEISEEDVDRVVEAAHTVAPPLNYEMLHIVPRGFTVDGQFGVKDPIGMTGIRLEVDTQIIHGLTTHLKNITKAVYRTGIDIDDLVLSILAAGDVVTTSRQKELGVTVVNVGGSITTMAVYEEGDIIHVAAMPIGSEHITNDLAIGLKTSIDIAERIKINFGECISKFVLRKERINLATVGADGSEEVGKKYVAEIIEARMCEILEKVNEQLSLVNRSGLLPAGVVFTGGGAKLGGLIDLAKCSLSLPASLGYPVDILSSTDKINDLSFSTAIGLVKWGAGLQQVSAKRKTSRFSVSGKVAQQVKKLFRSLIP